MEAQAFKRSTDDALVAFEQGNVELLSKFSEICKQKKALEAEEKKLKLSLLMAMEKNGVKKWENDFFSATYVAESTSKSFDSKKFKEDNPDVYELYLKESTRSASVRVQPK